MLRLRNANNKERYIREGCCRFFLPLPLPPLVNSPPLPLLLVIILDLLSEILRNLNSYFFWSEICESKKRVKINISQLLKILTSLIINISYNEHNNSYTLLNMQYFARRAIYFSILDRIKTNQWIITITSNNTINYDYKLVNFL